MEEPQAKKYLKIITRQPLAYKYVHTYIHVHMYVNNCALLKSISKYFNFFYAYKREIKIINASK